MITLKSGKTIELNQAFNCDCLEFMKELPDKCIDLTVTSPPYDNLRTYNDSLEWNENIWKSILKDLFRITKDGGVVVWIVGDATINGSETGTSFKQALYAKECGFNLHDTMVYMKNGPAYPSQNRYYSIFEYMFVFSKGKPKTYNPIRDRKNKWFGQKWSNKRSRRNKKGDLKESEWNANQGEEYGVRFNAWKYNVGHGYSTKDKIAYEHPAIFPEGLAEDHIKSWSNEGDIVYDPFAGSFTTPKMCYKNKRAWLASEVVEKYYNIGCLRYEQETKQQLFDF